MANDRVFLYHKELKIGLMLGKHLEHGWYKPPTEEKFQAFYDFIGDNNPDNLELLFECDGRKWNYGEPTEEGFRHFIWPKKEAADGNPVGSEKKKVV